MSTFHILQIAGTFALICLAFGLLMGLVLVLSWAWTRHDAQLRQQEEEQEGRAHHA